MCGGFNENLLQEEKTRGALRPFSKMNNFAEALADCMWFARNSCAWAFHDLDAW